MVFTTAFKNIKISVDKLTQQPHKYAVLLVGGNYRIQRKEVFSLTQNQIQFNKYLEDVRHNIETEKIEHRKAAAGEVSAKASQTQAQVAGARQMEDARHNLIEEGIKRGQLEISSGVLSETQRHQAAIEKLTESQIAEATRHNKMSEAISQSQIATSRDVGMAQAGASYAHARAAQTSAEASREQARVAGLRQTEDARHNKVAEGISEGQLEVAQRNASSTESQAQSAVRQAEAATIGALARATTAEVAANKQYSERVKNYASAFQSLISGASSLSGLAKSFG